MYSTYYNIHFQAFVAPKSLAFKLCLQFDNECAIRMFGIMRQNTISSFKNIESSFSLYTYRIQAKQTPKQTTSTQINKLTQDNDGLNSDMDFHGERIRLHFI